MENKSLEEMVTTLLHLKMLDMVQEAVNSGYVLTKAQSKKVGSLLINLVENKEQSNLNQLTELVKNGCVISDDLIIKYTINSIIPNINNEEKTEFENEELSSIFKKQIIAKNNDKEFIDLFLKNLLLKINSDIKQNIDSDLNYYSLENTVNKNLIKSIDFLLKDNQLINLKKELNIPFYEDLLNNIKNLNYKYLSIKIEDHQEEINIDVHVNNIQLNLLKRANIPHYKSYFEDEFINRTKTCSYELSKEFIEVKENYADLIKFINNEITIFTKTSADNQSNEKNEKIKLLKDNIDKCITEKDFLSQEETDLLLLIKDKRLPQIIDIIKTMNEDDKITYKNKDDKNALEIVSDIVENFNDVTKKILASINISKMRNLSVTANYSESLKNNNN